MRPPDLGRSSLCPQPPPSLLPPSAHIRWCGLLVCLRRPLCLAAGSVQQRLFGRGRPWGSGKGWESSLGSPASPPASPAAPGTAPAGSAGSQLVPTHGCQNPSAMGAPAKASEAAAAAALSALGPRGSCTGCAPWHPLGRPPTQPPVLRVSAPQVATQGQACRPATRAWALWPREGLLVC